VRAAWFILILTAALLVPVPAQAALPTPSWWNGTCDANHWNSAAASAGWHGAGAHALGASYLGVAVCGPRPSVDGAPDVRWTKSGWGEYEWECPELTMRFMALAYGVSAYSANGNTVVRNYSTSDGGGLVKVNNGTAGKPPLPGDIVSFDNSTDPPGHAGVIASSSVDSSGNGSVRMMSQNDTPDGWRTLAVSNWHLASFGHFVPYGWLHDPSSSGTTDRPPFGAVTKAAGSSGHKVRVKGWTIDPDTPTKATKVVVFVSGSKPSSFRIRIDGLADLYRADVASDYPKAGAYHGFDLHTTIQRAQTVHVTAYAIDTAGGPRALIGSGSVSVP
jgi:hypothetical protein